MEIMRFENGRIFGGIVSRRSLLSLGEIGRTGGVGALEVKKG